MFRPLSAAEYNVATPLLEVADQWIRDHKPGIDDDDPGAKVVVFEIVRSAMLYGKYAGLSSFQETTGNRAKAGAIDSSEVERFVTERHREILGLKRLAGPRGHFTKLDY